MDIGAMNMECVTIGIEAFPLHQLPQPPPKKILTDKLLAILRKYKFSWRIKQLAKPVRITHKYVFKEETKVIEFKPPLKLDDELKFYSDQLATPALKNLVTNKKLYGKISRKLNSKLNRNIKKAWNSIYNFYRKRERERKIRALKREQAKQGKEKPKVLIRVETLAKPKPVYKPLPPPPKKIFEAYDRLDVLASPKVHIVIPTKREGVNPHALVYEPTEVVFRLAKLPKRFEKLPKSLIPGAVKRSALRYKITPRIEALCVPKTTREKAKDDDDFDPFAISKNALKYKPTPRIMELAKPRELR